MTDPIDQLGDLQGPSSAARIGGPQMSGAPAGGAQPLGQILSMLAQEFGGYSSADQLAVLLASVRLVAGAGVPAVDVASAMYSSPNVLDALRDGNPELAKQMIVGQVNEALSQLRDVGVADAGLRTMSASGFSAVEIAMAMRTVPALQNALAQGDPAQLRQMLPTVHEMFRDDGRATHSDPALLAALGERFVPGLGGGQGAWVEQYGNRIRAAEKRSIGEVRLQDHPELILFPGSTPPPVDESSATFGAWVMAVVVGVALLLMILSRC